MSNRINNNNKISVVVAGDIDWCIPGNSIFINYKSKYMKYLRIIYNKFQYIYNYIYIYIYIKI